MPRIRRPEKALDSMLQVRIQPVMEEAIMDAAAADGFTNHNEWLRWILDKEISLRLGANWKQSYWDRLRLKQKKA